MKGKLLNISASISVLLWVSLTLTNSNAATHVVNSPADASLRTAIAQGGWIGFGFSGTVTLTNTIPITRNVFLDGSGVAVTISGGSAVRLFSVAPGVTFGVTNLTLANGTCLATNLGASADGGAIYNSGGNVALVGCTLTNHSAQYGNWGGLARGGAIFSDGGAVSLLQSSVSNNLAIAGGMVGPPINFTNRAFGGAIFSAGAALTITECVISSNLCQGLSQPNAQELTMGGAVFQASGSVAIENSLFASNQALGSPVLNGGYGMAGSPAYGGALAAPAGSASIKHSQFIGNAAQGGNGSHSPPMPPGPAFGGAVYSAGNLAAEDSSFIANQALAGQGRGDFHGAANGYGGAIYNSGTAAISSCSVYSNLVQGGVGEGSIYSGTGGDGSGGGIFNGGTVALNGCSIYSNAAQGGAGLGGLGGAAIGGVASGGAIFNAAQLGATNCTLALNSASGGAGQFNSSGSTGTNGNATGGAVFNDSNATFAGVNLTIASNACSSPPAAWTILQGTPWLAVTNGIATGFQIANTNGTLRLHNSLIAYSGTNANAYGTITDDGYNISSDGSAQLSGGSSYNFTDPKLGPLGGYGGPTLCMALLAGSPAIDTGDPLRSPSTDQRGAVRPFGVGPDMGAYEFGAAASGSTLNVSLDGPGIVTENPAYSLYPQGATVTMTAVPNGGCFFDHWSGDASGSTNPLTVTMKTNLAITAHFLAFPYTITLQTNGQGTVLLNPPWGTYPQGAPVTVTAAPNGGWYFDHWSGDATGSTNPLTVTVNTNLTITTHFLAFPYTITLQTNGPGAIALNPPGGSYLNNSLVTVTATPAPGSAFDSWSGAISSTANPLLLTVNSNLSLIGTFKQAPCVPPPSGLVGWWRAEGDSSDSSGTNNGILQGGAGFAAGKVGQAFDLNGTNQYVDVPDSPNLNPTDSISVEAWIYPRQPLNPMNVPVVTKGGGGGYGLSGYNYGAWITIEFYVYLSGGRGSILTDSPISTNRWSHVVGVYDGSLLSLYTNGVLAGTHIAAPGQLAPSGNHLQIGHAGSYNFNGLIDEASVYNRALSASEIAAIYNALSAGKCANQQVRPSLSITPTPSNVVVSFAASPPNSYFLQASTNLLTWTDLSTNGPFASSTNVIQTIGLQGFKSRYFRLRMK